MDLSYASKAAEAKAQIADAVKRLPPAPQPSAPVRPLGAPPAPVPPQGGPQVPQLAAAPLAPPVSPLAAVGMQAPNLAVPRAFARGGRVNLQQSLAVKDDIRTKNEQSVIDYHRDKLKNGTYQKNDDGSVTTFRGAVVPWTGTSQAIIPTYWDGEELPFKEATKRAKNSGISWPSYKTADEALAAEARLHKIMEADSDKSAYAKGGKVRNPKRSLAVQMKGN
jgi:hypothetical protein